MRGLGSAWVPSRRRPRHTHERSPGRGFADRAMPDARLGLLVHISPLTAKCPSKSAARAFSAGVVPALRRDSLQANEFTRLSHSPSSEFRVCPRPTLVPAPRTPSPVPRSARDPLRPPASARDPQSLVLCSFAKRGITPVGGQLSSICESEKGGGLASPCFSLRLPRSDLPG